MPNGVTGRDLVVAAIIVGCTMLLVSLARPVSRRILRALAGRALLGKTTRWRVRAPRVFGETDEVAELRRQQRIDATATVVARLFMVGAWLVATTLVLQQLRIDAVLAVSAAGFIGFGLAVGGQHSIVDFINGLHILFEDRLGEGDVVQIRIQDETQEATVIDLGAFATRFETETGVLHIANRELSIVVNLSQRGITAELVVRSESEESIPKSSEIELLLRSCYTRSAGYDANRDGLVLDKAERDLAGVRVTIRTARPLSDTQRDELAGVLGRRKAKS